jgi:N-acyl homoserine lactone hydrolase
MGTVTAVRALYPLQVATVRATGVPVPVYLLRLDGGPTVLVDTGCPAAMIDDPGAPFDVTAGSHVLGQLRRLGVEPAGVATVVVSHLDPDHAGANDAFPAAEFVIQRAQYEHARTSGLLRYEWLRPHWDDPRLRYRPLDGDTEVAPGLRAIECGGHVPGHQAVLAELPRTGPVLLAGDAWLRGTDPATRPMSPFDLDEAATRASQRRLAQLAEREGVALVIHNHDAEQWATLRDEYR